MYMYTYVVHQNDVSVGFKENITDVIIHIAVWLDSFDRNHNMLWTACPRKKSNGTEDGYFIY